MKFKSLHYSDKLTLLNPEGDVAICCLWTRQKKVIKNLESFGIDYSRVCVIGNFYGNGLPHLLRNLLYNPQIKYLIVSGIDLSNSGAILINFFIHGLEEATFLGNAVKRIKYTKQIIDDMVTPDMLDIKVTKLNNMEDGNAVKSFFNSLEEQKMVEKNRLEIPLPERQDVTRHPSHHCNHNIIKETPVEAWQELIFTLMRFGYKTKLRKGERIELLNVKIVIKDPIEQSLTEFGIDESEIRSYQEKILGDGEMGQDYSYGNRLRAHYNIDTLEEVVLKIKSDISTRHAYISLWDTKVDLSENKSSPCLVSLFFRVFEGKVNLTATFRTHNALDAWLKNFYGLIAIQSFICDETELVPGAITVFSHSISIDTNNLDRAKLIAKSRSNKLEEDEKGNFIITTSESNEIIVHQVVDGVIIKEYKGYSASQIRKQLVYDNAVSNISHALYLGQELGRIGAFLGRENK